MANNEAPVVMFTNYKRSDGFEVSLTLRGESLKDVATELDNAIKLIAEKGGTPVIRSFGKKEAKTIEYVEDRKCPKDDARIVKGEGRVKEKCEHYKFDFATKKNIGTCDYIVWN